MTTGYQGYKSQDYEVDQRWTDVDKYTSKHLHTDKPLNDALEQTLRASDENGLPAISVSEHQGKFLMLQARVAGAKHILEVGLLGGYSTTWLANSAPDVRVTTVEYNAQYAEVARANLERAGVADRVEIIVGAGADVLPRLVEEVRGGSRPPFGFFFIDADKENNWTYVDLAAQMASPNACVIVDNVVRKGQLAHESADERVNGSRKLVEKLSGDKRVDATVIQWVSDKNYDGFLMGVVNA